MKSLSRSILVTISLLAVVLIATMSYAIYEHIKSTRVLTAMSITLASSTTSYETRLSEQNVQLSDAQTRSLEFSNALSNEQRKSEDYAGQILQLTGTVRTLTKLTTIDPQLLAKYSKVYFLNENYIPANLSQIPTEETYDTSRLYQFEGDALPFLNSMIKDARDEDTGILVVSAYRSFKDQSSLKASYRVTYGAGTANSFSADQGYSEHQLGTTIDFTTNSLGENFTSFDSTKAYAWLNDNAYKYGFIISYPKANKYYTYEPWHWRFVGIKLATKLHDDSENFYDIDQRTINSYLVNLFDQ